MSDTQAPLDTPATHSVASTPVAPPSGGEAPEATPASADTAVPGDPDAGQPQAEPKRDRKVEKRISRLTQQREAALHEAGYWRGVAEARSVGQQPAQEPAPEGDTQPERKQPPSQDPDADRLAREISQKIYERIVETGKDIEDLDEVMETITARSFPINETIRDYLAISDHPAQLAQWMSGNRDEVRAIAALTPAVATKALEKVDARFAKKPAPPVSRAPAPPPQISGGGGAAPNSVERMSHADLLKWTSAQARR